MYLDADTKEEMSSNGCSQKQKSHRDHIPDMQIDLKRMQGDAFEAVGTL